MASPALVNAAKAFLAARLEQLLGVAGGIQARLVSAGLLSPTADVRVPIAAGLLLAWYAVKFAALRLLKAVLLPVRVPRISVQLTAEEANLKPGGKWVRPRCCAHASCL